MSVNDLVRYGTWLIYADVFVSVLRDAIRQPRRSTINIALFFACPFLTIVNNVLLTLGVLGNAPLVSAINSTLILSSGLVLLRLVGDFAAAPPTLLGVGAAALVALGALSFGLSQNRPLWLLLAQVIFFAGLQCYAAAAFSRSARRASGVTCRRMRAAALGSLLLAGATLLGGLQFIVPGLRLPSLLLSLAASLCYVLGFATPRAVRRTWQEPELRAFLGRAASLPRLPDTRQIVAELERGATESLGALAAKLSLTDPAGESLVFGGAELAGPDVDAEPLQTVFREQRPLFVNPGAGPALLAAPVTAGEHRLGVLAVYDERAPLFADDDLALVQLLADQAAVILESRILIDEAARVRAQEEAVRLKDDFLSAAAHDLRTPLTTLMGRAQLMERRALRDPQAPADLAGVRIILKEAQRLRGLVFDLLDAARADSGQLVGKRELLDLGEILRAVCADQSSSRHECNIVAPEPVLGWFDRGRMAQLLDNLLQNAIKYTPEGGPIHVRAWNEPPYSYLTVADTGVGIPLADLPHVFDRFYRADNANDVQFSGLGLGLYICRTIAEQHGGAIWATPNQPQGTIIHIRLPHVAAAAERAAG